MLEWDDKSAPNRELERSRMKKLTNNIHVLPTFINLAQLSISSQDFRFRQNTQTNKKELNKKKKKKKSKTGANFQNDDMNKILSTSAAVGGETANHKKWIVSPPQWSG